LNEFDRFLSQLIGLRQTGMKAGGFQFLYMSPAAQALLPTVALGERALSINFNRRWFFAFALVECAPLQMGR